MTANEDPPTGGSHVGLSWAFDDPENPTRVTVFDPRDDVTTRWITVRRDDAYELDTVA